MENYEVKIVEASKQLTARERIKFKDTTAAISIDQATEDADIVIEPISYAIVAVHNENSDNKDYMKYVIEAKDGELYSTGSESFWKSFKSIYDEMENEDEKWALRIYKRESVNYKGKKFITCTIV